MPTFLGDIRTHIRLSSGMARATGVDLVDAFEQEHLSQQDYADLVTACRGCSCARQCHDWLDTAWDVPYPVPESCPNKPTWERLRALKP